VPVPQASHYPEVDRPVVAMAKEFPAGTRTGRHSHARAQLLFAVRGLMVANTAAGTWVVPSGYALWIPPGVPHDVSMHGQVAMRTAYVRSREAAGLHEACWVLPVGRLDAQRLTQRRGAEMAERAERGGGEAEPRGLAADRLEERTDVPLLEVARAAHQDLRRDGRADDGPEVPRRVEGQVALHVLEHEQHLVRVEQRQPVRGGAHDRLGADGAVRAGAVLDHPVLPQGLACAGGEQARGRVHRPARRVGDHDPGDGTHQGMRRGA